MNSHPCHSVNSRVFGIGALAIATCLGGLTVSAQTVAYWRLESGSFLDDSSGNGFTLSPTSDQAGTAATATTIQYVLPSSGAGSAYPKAFSGVGANAGAAQGAATDSGFAGNFFRTVDQPLLTMSSGFTIEAFVTPSASSGTGRAIAAQGGGATDGGWFFGFDSSNRLTLQFASAAGAWAPLAKNTGTNFTFTTGHDYYVAAALSVVTGSSYQINFYIQDLTSDGDLVTIVATGTGSTIAFYDTSLALTIGGSVSGAWKGLIDEVRLSNGQLTADQLLINSASTIPEPSSFALLLGGLAAGAVLVRRKRCR